jgi:hypothetical protein
MHDDVTLATVHSYARAHAGPRQSISVKASRLSVGSTDNSNFETQSLEALKSNHTYNHHLFNY